MQDGSTSGAMQQGYAKLVLLLATVPVLNMLAELLRLLLVVIFIVSPALTRHHPTNGTPPTHCGIAKAAIVLAGVAIPVVHRGSGRPCPKKLHPTLKLAGAIRAALLQTRLALNSWRFMYTSCVAGFLQFSITFLICSELVCTHASVLAVVYSFLCSLSNSLLSSNLSFNSCCSVSLPSS